MSLSSLEGKKSINILFIAAEFPPCGGAGVGRIQAIAKHLAQSSQVTVLTASPNTFTIVDDSYLADTPNLQSVVVYSPNLKNHLRRLRKLLPFLIVHDHYALWARRAFTKFKSLHKATKFDLVISSYPSFSNHWVAYQASQFAQIPWIADFRDPPPWMYDKSEANVSSTFFSRPTALVTTTERAKQLFLENFPSLSSPSIQVIGNGCDELASLIERTVQNDVFTVTHTGSFYSEGRDIHQLILALKLVDIPMNLRFIGDPPTAEVIELIRQESLTDRVEFLPYLPAKDALQAAANSDALVVIQGNLFGNQIPGKTYEYLAMQKPVLVITNKGSATYEAVINEPNAIVAEYGNKESIKDALNAILNHEITPIDRSKYCRSHMSVKFTSLVEGVYKYGIHPKPNGVVDPA